jgi:pilus assembly protein Flp/PilA
LESKFLEQIILSTTVKEGVMNTLISKIKAFVQEEDGLAAVEYAVIAALIAAGLIAAFTLLGEEIEAVITRLTETLAAGAGS